MEHRRPDEDTLTRRRRRVLGEDHPDTLLSATNLAADLRLAQAAYLAGGVTVAPT